jgi:AraC-like DNA-binding protein
MAALLCDLRASDKISTAGVWEYHRPLNSGAVELGTVRGLDVALPIHFHDEDQMTFVLSGRRRFIIGDDLLQVGPGQGVRIPAGTPHRSLGETSELLCINIYMAPGGYSADELISSLARLRHTNGHPGWADLVIVIEQNSYKTGLASAQQNQASSYRGPGHSVAEAAQISGMSREGFSRHFKKSHGMPPRWFHLIAKLNDARRLLRMGESIAGVAAQTGFADQSHMGRLFRRVFGVSPGRYSAG